MFSVDYKNSSNKGANTTMSVLKMYGRPYVKFDPANTDHRRYFKAYLDKRGWGDCPVRFVIEDQAGADLVALMQRRLLEYYINQEFTKA